MMSPLSVSLALRAGCRYSLGLPGFADDFDRAATLARSLDATSYLAVQLWRHLGVLNGALDIAADELDEAKDVLVNAQRSGDDFGLNSARAALALALAYGDCGDSPENVESQLLSIREEFQTQSYANHLWLPRCDQLIAGVRARQGDYDGAIDLIQSVLDDDLDAGLKVMAGSATMLLVESLLRRGNQGDLERAESAMTRLAAEPVDSGFVLYELPLLRMRALVAQTRGDHAGYVDYRDRYRAMAHRVDFKPHIAMAEAMP